jgi:hypothetical protein
MLKYEVTPEWASYALRKSTKQAFNSNTILEDGAGQLTGTLGELAFGRWLKDAGIAFEYVADNKGAYDFVVNGLKIDVKSKGCTSPPRPNYTCHVLAAQATYDVDLYVFCRTDISGHVWLLGWMHKNHFWTSGKACDVTRGQMADGLIQTADSRRIQISDIATMDGLCVLLTTLSAPA